METNKIYLGDCLELSQEIAPGSVDLILSDLPYGIVKNMAKSETVTHGMKGKTEWDLSINPSKIFDVANRILRKNGKMVLFSQEPYTNELRNAAHNNTPFLYRMIWQKDHFANSLIAKKAPVSFYEDVLVFSKKYDVDGLHPLREYFKKLMNFIGLGLKQINGKLGHRRAEHAFYINSTQHGLCTKETYQELIEKFNINSMPGFKEFEELLKIDTPSLFNLWEGKKYKSNILKYKKDYGGLHSTQKPVLLCEDLIKTFSNENDLVVDLTAGSGTSAVAAINTNRQWICMEKDTEIFAIAERRINERLAENEI